MSSALVMVLVAAMAVPGSGPETVSGETEQGLDLRGEWEGTLHGQNIICRAAVSGNKIVTYDRSGAASSNRLRVVNEGKGQIQIVLDWTVCHGIYEQHGDCVLVAYRGHELKRPTALWCGKKQALLILHRVKSRK